jgi:hypothetical protein
MVFLTVLFDIHEKWVIAPREDSVPIQSRMYFKNLPAEPKIAKVPFAHDARKWYHSSRESTGCHYHPFFVSVGQNFSRKNAKDLVHTVLKIVWENVTI